MLVIVPSGTFLDIELSVETGCKSNALIPLGGKPLILHILDEYRRVDPEVVLVLVVPCELVSLLNQYAEPALKIVGIKDSMSIAHSILTGLYSVETYDSVVIHMGDTLITLPDTMLLDNVFTAKRNDLYRWTNLVEENGIIRILHDRDPGYLNSYDGTVAVGVFSFSDGESLLENLENATAINKQNLDPFFTAISSYSKIHPMQLDNAQNWYDFGHVDKYYESKLLYQNLRHFNHLTYDRVTGKITKTSTNISQFRNQVRWFKQVPDALRSYCPHIYDSSDGFSPFITMELLPFPTLTELFVYKRINIGAWNPVVNMISNILNRFSQYQYQTSTACALAQAIYRDKTVERINQLIQQQAYAANLSITYNGKNFNLFNVLENLEQFLNKFELLSLEYLSPIHGDFCFSNLLYDNRSGIIKMIDARGEFGVPGIYGDPRYDLAKLFHSIDGGYDFIIMDRFSAVVLDSGEIELNLFKDDYHNNVSNLFEMLLLKDKKFGQQVKAIQALLFLSMLPLHQDKPQRQLAMLYVGLKQFANLMSNKD